jgi:tocopherol O-methyltransferase
LCDGEIAVLRALDEEYRGVFRKCLVTSHVQDVAIYFDGKTEAILNRYGPGPRVHYHTGLVDDPPHPNASSQILRRQLVGAQERMLRYAANVWNASSTLTGEVVDVGCGLGGGAIFWAQEFGAQVTAVTCVRSHIDLVTRFAAQAGVGSRVEPILWDAAEMPGENRFDAAVAVDSSGYLPRKKWFHRLAALLRPGGRVLILDCFLGRPGHENSFNRHWHTRIGSIEEYVGAATDAGFRLESLEDISHHTEHFWTTTIALMEAEAKQEKLGSVEAVRQGNSLYAHAMVRQGLADGRFCYALMSFSRCR